MENVLEIENLEKRYDSFCLDKISFSVRQGYIMGYIGPNGAGKTTTIKAILDIIRVDGGEIRIFGQSLTSSRNSIKQRIGFLMGDNAYYEFLTAGSMANVISKFYTRWDWKVFERMMKEFELNQNQKLEAYSKGMKIKYMLACALSHNAELFILDEPTSGLDPVFRSELMEIFQSLIADGERSILFSTHITSDLESIADYITFINKGRIVFSEEKDAVLDKYVLIKGRKDQRSEIEGSKKVLGILDSNLGFSALTNDREWFQKQFKGNLIIEKATLEDIMIHSVRGNRNDKLAI